MTERTAANTTFERVRTYQADLTGIRRDIHNWSVIGERRRQSHHR